MRRPSSVGTAPISTRPRSKAVNLAPYSPQFQTEGSCLTEFMDLPVQDRQNICNALTTADKNIRKLVEAINNYATALLEDRKTLEKRLKDYLDEAQLEKEKTGSVSADTQEKVKESAAEFVKTEGEVTKLTKQLDAYRKLPNIIGNYNKYFAQLVETLQGARTAKESVGVEEEAKVEGEEEEEEEEGEAEFEEEEGEEVGEVQVDFNPVELGNLFEGIMNNENIDVKDKINAMRKVVNDESEIRNTNPYMRWIDLYGSIDQNAKIIDGLRTDGKVTNEEIERRVNNQKGDFEQQISNLQLGDAYKELMRQWLVRMYGN